jgi:hypothetical protein
MGLPERQEVSIEISATKEKVAMRRVTWWSTSRFPA